MTTDEQRSIGRLEGKLDLLIDKVDALEDKVDHIITEGCTRREGHERNLKELDERVKKVENLLVKAVVIGIIMAGGGASSVQLIKLLM